MSINKDCAIQQPSQAVTDTERVIAKVWSEVLQVPEADCVTDDFFAVGGNSMTMVMLEFRIMEELAVELPPGVLLSAPTVRELASQVDAQLGRLAKSDD